MTRLALSALTDQLGFITPGPWHVVVGDNYTVEAAAVPTKYPHHFDGDDLGRFVAMVGNRQEDFGRADANLIAVAPRLLSELTFAAKLLRAQFGSTAQVERMEAVIAMAVDGEA